jgi:hypothetical protein
LAISLSRSEKEHSTKSKVCKYILCDAVFIRGSTMMSLCPMHKHAVIHTNIISIILYIALLCLHKGLQGTSYLSSKRAHFAFGRSPLQTPA